MTVATERAFVVPQRFCGPPASGNGGYSCGLTAQALSDQTRPNSAAVECTIRKPIPIGRELRVELRDGGAVALDDGEVIIEAKLANVEVPVSPFVSASDARAAMDRSPAFHEHPFPTCFVCGPERGEQDGLRIFPGRVVGDPDFTDLYAAAWKPASEFADLQGAIKPEFVWAAMDCPTGFAAGFPYRGKLVTGRLAVKMLAPVRAEADCVIMSWSLGEDGRKCHAGAALYQGELTCAIARATWIRVE